MSADTQLKELRRQHAARYKKLSGVEKPRVEPCPDCNEPPYKNNVCPETGIFHDRERHVIVGGAVVRSNIVRSSELMEAIDQSRVRWVESRTRLVRADAVSLNLFQSFVRQLDWSMQRYGILYGKYDAELMTIEVHAVYEPEQVGDACAFSYLPDQRLRVANRIAELLGLRRVGAICTHPPRDAETMVLSSREMLLCTREQSRFGDECVLLTMGPNQETGRVECQAWQTSPQAVHFYRLGALHEKPGDIADVETAKYVCSDISLEVAQQETDEKGHPRIVTRAASKEIDARWFTSYVAVQQFNSPVVQNLFMRISRPGVESPTLKNLRNYMEDPKRRNVSLVEKLADFHVLIFLADSVFSLENDIPVIIDVIMKRRPAGELKHYEVLLETMMKL